MKISVIIPFYNRKKTLPRAIESVLNQNYQNFEIILVDDFSTDKFKEVLIKYKEDSRIRLIKNFRSKGVAGARNSGILEASGDYISFLDSDDEWFENHLLYASRSLAYTGYFVYSCLWKEETSKGIIDFELHSENTEMFQVINNNYSINETINSWIFDEKFFQLVLKYGIYCFNINSLVINKEIFSNSEFLFDEKFSMSEDALFIYKILSSYNLVTNIYHGSLYHLGDISNLYAFYDRSDADLFQLIGDKNTLKKINANLVCKSNFWLNVIRLIPNNSEKKEIKRTIQKKYFKKCLSGAYINRNITRLTFLLKALIYLRDKEDFRQIIRYKTISETYLDLD